MKKLNLVEKVKVLPRWIGTNKYFLVIIIFIGWLLFFDKYNFATQRKLTKTLIELQDEKLKVEREIEETKRLLLVLDDNKEKYARERYYMHAENEDVYIINTEIK